MIAGCSKLLEIGSDLVINILQTFVGNRCVGRTIEGAQVVYLGN